MTHDKNAQYAATVLRIALGVMFLAHGLVKLFIFTPAGTNQFFSSLGVPGFFGSLAMTAEIIGGIALILGIYSRAIVIALIPLLIGAVLLVHGDKGWMFNNEGGGWEYLAFLIIASIVQIFLGDGAFSAKQFIPFMNKNKAL